jgi:hypothetical protein
MKRNPLGRNEPSSARKPLEHSESKTGKKSSCFKRVIGQKEKPHPLSESAGKEKTDSRKRARSVRAAHIR